MRRARAVIDDGGLEVGDGGADAFALEQVDLGPRGARLQRRLPRPYPADWGESGRRQQLDQVAAGETARAGDEDGTWLESSRRAGHRISRDAGIAPGSRP